MDPQSQLELSKLNDADKKELNQILQNESQKSTIQQSEYSTRPREERRFPKFPSMGAC